MQDRCVKVNPETPRRRDWQPDAPSAGVLPRAKHACLIHASFTATEWQTADSARRCRSRKSRQKSASDLDSTNGWIPKLDVAGSRPDADLVKQLIRPQEGWFRDSVFIAACLFLEQRPTLLSPRNLLHVTNQLYKEGILVQIRWMLCNKTSNLQCCQYHALIRILPEEPNYFRLILFPPLVCRTPPLARAFASFLSPSSAHSWPHPPGARHSPFRD
jgi:hypothetical protein